MKLITGLCLLFVACVVVSATEDAAQRQARGFDERKYRYEQDKKEVGNFLNTKNLIRTVVKLLFGSSEESSATSRQVLNVLVKVSKYFTLVVRSRNLTVENLQVLDMVRTSFGQRARSAAQGRGIRDALDDATLAGVSMLKGYVKGVLSKDGQCAQKHICEASKEAVRDGRELGFLVAQFGG